MHLIKKNIKKLIWTYHNSYKFVSDLKNINLKYKYIKRKIK